MNNVTPLLTSHKRNMSVIYYMIHIISGYHFISTIMSLILDDNLMIILLSTNMNINTISY